jgi:rRNA maturation endonuclease Nob1
MGSCIDLTRYQDDSEIQDAFSSIVSGGRYGFKSVVEGKKKEVPRCTNCKNVIQGTERFCPECGFKLKQ